MANKISAKAVGLFENAGRLVVADNRNRQLEKELEDISLKVRGYDELLKENERMKLMLGYQGTPGVKFIPASVIGQMPSAEYDGFIVDKGTAEGVERDMPAIAFKGRTIGVAGRVVESNNNTSKILLINDTACEISAMVQRSREQGIVTGFDGSYLRMKYLSPQSDVEKGDVVITSGLGGIFPKGLCIGSVERIVERQYDLQKEAVIVPEINVRKTEELLILKKYEYSEQAGGGQEKAQ